MQRYRVGGVLVTSWWLTGDRVYHASSSGEGGSSADYHGGLASGILLDTNQDFYNQGRHGFLETAPSSQGPSRTRRRAWGGRSSSLRVRAGNCQPNCRVCTWNMQVTEQEVLQFPDEGTRSLAEARCAHSPVWGCGGQRGPGGSRSGRAAGGSGPLGYFTLTHVTVLAR